MAIKKSEIEVDTAQPFRNCVLDREKYANILTSLIESYSDGFVLAINNKWGAGKTTFIKMWEQQLKNQQYHTIYFNAWENDLENNPIAALIGELKIMVGVSNKEKFKKVVNSAAKLSKNAGPAIVKALLNKYIDMEVLVEGITESVKTTTEIFEQEVNEYTDRKESITEFKKNLEKFIKENTQGKPLIFMIDELDRCRPNYAVSLLEQIKHFFNITNIVFILSIDKMQLANAICGVYGSEKIDSNEYLKRFIDIEYSIPDPSNGKYFDYLYNYFEYDQFFKANKRLEHYELKYDKESFISTCKMLFVNCNLRQLEKIMSTTRLILRTINENQHLIPTLFVFLIYIKFMNSEYYEKIIQKKYSIKNLQADYYKTIKPFLSEDNEKYFIEIEGSLLIFYNNYIFQYRNSDKIFTFNRTTRTLELKIDSSINNQLLLNFYSNNDLGFSRVLDLSLEYFISRIELTENFKT